MSKLVELQYCPMFKEVAGGIIHLDSSKCQTFKNLPNGLTHLQTKKNGEKKINMRKLTKHIGSLWNGLPQEEKTPYETSYYKDKEIYDKKIEEYKRLFGFEKKDDDDNSEEIDNTEEIFESNTLSIKKDETKIPKKISEKIENASKDITCKVCMENVIDTCIIDCGHACLCGNCARKIMTEEEKKCPMCRTKIIKGILDMFIS